MTGKAALWGAVFVAALAVVLIVFWPRQPTLGNAGIELAEAWAKGDVDAIYRFSPPGERAVLTKDALAAVYRKVVTESIGGMSVVRVRTAEERKSGKALDYVVEVEYRASDGTLFGNVLDVRVSASGKTAAALWDLWMLVTDHVRATEKLEYGPARKEAKDRLWPVLRDAGIRHLYSPGDGLLIDIDDS